MNRLATKLVVLIASGCFVCFGSNASPSPQDVSPPAAKYNEDGVLKRLFPVLSGGAGRVYYSADCPVPNEDDKLPFPHTSVQPLSENAQGLAAVRVLFANDADVEVTDGPIGIPRIKVGQVSDVILKTKISHLTLKPLDRYNPILIIGAILSNRDVKATMRTLKIRPALRMMDYLLQEPLKGLPHFPSSVRNRTVDQLLDQIAQTFGGIVIYGACAKPSLFDIEFGRDGDPVFPPEQ